MSKRRKQRAGDWQLCMSFDAETLESHVAPADLAGNDAPADVSAGLPTDQPPPPEPEMLSERTRVVVARPDEPAPTVMAHGMGDAKMGQAFLGTDAAPNDESAARLRVDVPADRPAPTVTADGIGGWSERQYRVVPSSGSPPTDGEAAFLDEMGPDRTGPRRILIDADEPSPTVMAEGLGGERVVNRDAYAIVSRPVIVDRFKDDEQIGVDEQAPTLRTESHGHPSGVRTPHVAFMPGPDLPPPAISGKPAFRIPLMTEIAALPWNGLTIVSTFSGCGGSCLGYKMAGYKVAWANEFVPAARDTYRANHPGTHLDDRDIRLVTAASIREVIGDVEIDVLEGSPPCASFSTAGKTSKGWGQVRKYSDVTQRTDDLFDQFIRLVDELRPRAFTAENVAGMVKGVAKGFFLHYLRRMNELPYNVEARLVDAQYLGVPQRRVRLIFVGVRKDVGKPAWPRKLPYRYSIREAIPWIAQASARAHSPTDWVSAEQRMSADEPAPSVQAGMGGSYHGHEVVADGAPAPRVIYHEGFSGTPPRDVTDEPAPTVKIGTAAAICSTHFLVEGNGPPDADTRVSRKGLDSGEIIGTIGNSDFERRVVSLDEVAPTIQTGPDLGGFAVRRDETRVIVGGSAPSGQRGETSLDDPAPTVVGGNQGGKCQFYVENEQDVSRDVEPKSALGRAVGAEWDKLEVGGQSEKYLNLIRPDPDVPCPTVTQLGGTSAASVTHPFERRKFTIAELRRICGFPDDFILTGSYAQQWERMGRAVPPPMMAAVAAALVPVLRKKDGA